MGTTPYKQQLHTHWQSCDERYDTEETHQAALWYQTYSALNMLLGPFRLF